MGEYTEQRVKVPALKKWLKRHGAVICEPQSSDEVLRFETDRGHGVVHRSNTGVLLTNAVAGSALHCFCHHAEWTGGLRRQYPPMTPAGKSTKRKKRTPEEHSRVVRFLARRDGGFACAYCGSVLSPSAATLEHVVPLSKGGPDDAENMVIACFECNNLAGDLSVMEKLKKIRERLARLEAAENAAEIKEDFASGTPAAACSGKATIISVPDHEGSEGRGTILTDRRSGIAAVRISDRLAGLPRLMRDAAMRCSKAGIHASFRRLCISISDLLQASSIPGGAAPDPGGRSAGMGGGGHAVPQIPAGSGKIS